MRIFIDIETIGTTDPAVIAEIEAGISAPANYSKPESIQQWMETKGEIAKREAVGKTALDAALGSVIAIAWATVDMDEPACLVRDPADPDDHELLENFIGQVDRTLKAAGITSPTDGSLIHVPDFYPIAHNAVFDIGYLWRRLVVNGIRPPFAFPSPATWRYGRDYSCTMVAWAGHKDRISLDRLCKALRVPSPKADGIDGSKVGDLWNAGDLDAIREYNRRDCVAVRACWERMEAIRGAA